MDNLVCAVCKDDGPDSRMCPKCYKHFCWTCLCGALYRCKHCKAKVDPSEYVKVPWLQQLKEEFRRKSTSSSAAADNCSSHPKKQLSIYCQQCKKTLCGSCWKQDHEGHTIVPLEEAHEQCKTSLERFLDETEAKRAKIKAFRDSLAQDLTLLRSNLDKVKVDEIIRTSEVQRIISSSFEKEYSALVAPLEDLHSQILNRITCTRFFVDKANNIVRDPKLNALVDQWPELIEGPYSEEEENKLEREMEEYQSSDKKRMEFATPWKPDWDMRGEVGIVDCLSGPKIVTRFVHRDITWHVCVNNPFAVCPLVVKVKVEGRVKGMEQEQEEMPSLQTVTVFMEGRPSLKNYEFVIESINSEDSEPELKVNKTIDKRDLNRSMFSDEGCTDEEENDDDDALRPSLLPTPLRVSIVRKKDFVSGEELQFPLGDVKKWIDSKGRMSFRFMVRPLTFQQKCVDLEFYLAKIQGGDGGNSSVGDPSSFVGTSSSAGTSFSAGSSSSPGTPAGTSSSSASSGISSAGTSSAGSYGGGRSLDESQSKRSASDTQIPMKSTGRTRSKSATTGLKAEPFAAFGSAANGAVANGSAKNAAAPNGSTAEVPDEIYPTVRFKPLYPSPFPSCMLRAGSTKASPNLKSASSSAVNSDASSYVPKPFGSATLVTFSNELVKPPQSSGSATSQNGYVNSPKPSDSAKSKKGSMKSPKPSGSSTAGVYANYLDELNKVILPDVPTTSSSAFSPKSSTASKPEYAFACSAQQPKSASLPFAHTYPPAYQLPQSSSRPFDFAFASQPPTDNHTYSEEPASSASQPAAASSRCSVTLQEDAAANTVLLGIRKRRKRTRDGAGD